MKPLILLIYLMLPLAIMPSKLVELNIKTRYETGAGMETGNLSFWLCNHLTPSQTPCEIIDIDNPNRDDFQEGFLDDFTGSELQDCEGYEPGRATATLVLCHRYLFVCCFLFI